MQNRGALLFLSSLFIIVHTCRIPAASQETQIIKEYKNADLAEWETVVGDGLYAARGEKPVNQKDIATLNYRNHSELRANTKRRRIMAHNITLKRVIDDGAFDYVHTYRVKFRLPHMPSEDDQSLNGETVEMGLFVWDGKNTRLDYGTAYQWKINPGDHDNYGVMQYWNKEKWVPAGKIEPDTEWHEIQMIVNFKTKTTEVKIDGVSYPSKFSQTAKASDWKVETAARIQMEIISAYPEPSGIGTTHSLDVKDWCWNWGDQPESLTAKLTEVD